METDQLIRKENLPNWVDKNLYPFTPAKIKLRSGLMNFVDEGQGETILFVHGTPTWSFLYRDFIKELSHHYRCIAVDHLGFGLSDKPKLLPGTPKMHAEQLVEFINILELDNITLVVHDFGGPIGLGAALDMPEKIDKIVLFNSWLWSTYQNKSAQQVDRIARSWLGKFLYLNLNVSPRYLLKQGFHDSQKLTDRIHRQYTAPFPDRSSRLFLLRLAQSLVGSSEWYDTQWNRLGKLEEKKWLILWGEKDSFITMEHLEKWRERIPTAETHVFPCGHFIQEELPAEALEKMQAFLHSSQ